MTILLLALCAKSLFPAFEVQSFDARSFGMGEAFVAVSDNNSGLIFNPAGLAKINRFNVSAFYAMLYSGLDDGSKIGDISFAGGYPIKDFGTLSLGYFSRALDSLYSETLLTFGGGMFVMEKLSLGAALRSLSISTSLSSTALQKKEVSDIGLSAGLLYYGEDFNLGISASDINSPQLSMTRLENKILMSLRFGAAYIIRDKTKKQVRQAPREEETGQAETENESKKTSAAPEKEKALISFDYMKKGADTKISFGGEVNFLENLFSIRAGYISAKNSSALAAGFGINISKTMDISLDYGLNFPLKGLEGLLSHRVGISLGFGPEVSTARKPSRKKARTSFMD